MDENEFWQREFNQIETFTRKVTEDYEKFIFESIAEDITEFGDCLRTECPFYYTTEYKPTKKITPHCRKAESEVSE